MQRARLSACGGPTQTSVCLRKLGGQAFPRCNVLNLIKILVAFCHEARPRASHLRLRLNEAREIARERRSTDTRPNCVPVSYVSGREPPVAPIIEFWHGLRT